LEQTGGNTPPGTWKFVREIGRGGMGIVYLAEKPDPGDASITLRAAIKVLRHQPDADIFWSRFRLERQILGHFLSGNRTDEAIRGAVKHSRKAVSLGGDNARAIDELATELERLASYQFHLGASNQRPRVIHESSR
jgi:serine/threonine protein kinase